MRIFTIIILFFILGFATYAQTRDNYEMSEEVNLVKSVQIFPNPAIDVVHIKLATLTARDVSLTLHNIIGNQIPVDTEIVNEYEIKIWVKDLTAGYYLVALKDKHDNFSGTYKFLKR